MDGDSQTQESGEIPAPPMCFNGGGRMSDVSFNSKDDEIAALRAVIVEFVDFLGGYKETVSLRDPVFLAVRYRACDIVPGIRGQHPDVWQATVDAARKLRVNQS